MNDKSITFNEFRAWLIGLIQGKKGELPDIEDWKEIKKKLDIVVPDKEYVHKTSEYTTPYMPDTPAQPSWEWNPNTSPFYYIGDSTDTNMMVTTSTDYMVPSEQLNLEFSDAKNMADKMKKITINDNDMQRVLDEALSNMINDFNNGKKETD